MDSTIRGTGMTITFDGGKPVEVYEIEQEQDTIQYWSALATKPDSTWRYTDEHGHKHRWKQDDDEQWRVTKSVERLEHVPCDGACGGWCEGYDITVYECSKCGERLKPNVLPDNRMKSLPGMVTITATVKGRERDMPDYGARSSFVLTENGRVTMRGTSDVFNLRSESGGPTTAKVHLVPSRDHATA